MAGTQGIQILRDTARAAFWQGWDNFPSITESIAYTMDSNSDQETYAWLAYAPGVREMAGGSKLKQSVPEISFTVKNKIWEATTSVPYLTWKFNKNGAIARLAEETGKKARAHRDKLISLSLMDVGASTTCYDGQYFYDTDHSDPGSIYMTNQTNMLSYAAASGTAPNDVELAGAIGAAITRLMSFRDGAGDPVTYGAVQPGGIEVHSSAGTGADQASLLMKVAYADYLTSGNTNQVKGLFKPVFNPFLTTGQYLHVFNTGTSRKPFILQVAEDVRMEDDFGGDEEFNTKDRSFGSFGCYNATYGDWRSAVQVTFI